MVLKADQERLKALLSETVLLLCKNGLEFKSDFCIEALIGITVDQDDVFLISIKETVENELRAAQRAKEEAEKLALEAAQSPAPESPSRTHRKRKRKSPRPQSPSQDKNIKLETSGDRELDNNTSNTSFQDYNDESQHSRNMKFESGGAGDMGGDDEDNSNEIVFVKTENTDDQSLYGGPGQSSFLDSPYQSGMDSSQMSSSFQSPGAHSSHPGTSSWQSPMDSSQQGMSQNPLETQQNRMILTQNKTIFPHMEFPLNRMEFPLNTMDFSNLALKKRRTKTCPVCDKTLADGNKLKRHMDTVHSDSPKPHTCTECGNKFSRRDHLKRHLTNKCTSGLALFNETRQLSVNLAQGQYGLPPISIDFQNLSGDMHKNPLPQSVFPGNESSNPDKSSEASGTKQEPGNQSSDTPSGNQNPGNETTHKTSEPAIGNTTMEKTSSDTPIGDQSGKLHKDQSEERPMSQREAQKEISPYFRPEGGVTFPQYEGGLTSNQYEYSGGAVFPGCHGYTPGGVVPFQSSGLDGRRGSLQTPPMGETN